MSQLTANDSSFRTLYVAETPHTRPATAGLKIVPNYTFANAPQPKVVVIGAQSGRSPLVRLAKKDERNR